MAKYESSFSVESKSATVLVTIAGVRFTITSHDGHRVLLQVGHAGPTNAHDVSKNNSISGVWYAHRDRPEAERCMTVGEQNELARAMADVAAFARI